MLARGIFLLLLFVCVSLFGETNVETEANSWLKKMGFVDYPEKISINLNEQQKQVKKHQRKQVGLSPVSEDVMRFSQDRYQVINHARNLASFIYSRTKNNIATSEEAQRQVAELTARMMILQPEEMPDKWPNEIKTEQEKEEYATKLIAKNIRNTSERVVADVVATIYGKETSEIIQNPAHPKHADFVQTVTRVRNEVFPYVKLMHLDVELGQSKYLGDTMALLYTRDSRKREGNNGKLEQLLSEQARKHGSFLENSVSSTPIFLNKENAEVKVNVNNGDSLYEYSGQREAAEIAWAGRPSLSNTPRAMRYNMLGHAANRLIHWDDKRVPDPKSYFGRVRMWLAEKDFANTGISHVGEARVTTDLETNISHVMVNDMYPDSVYGGVRKITLGNFALQGPYQRVVVTSPDPEKLAAHFLEQSKDIEDPSQLWKSEVMRYNNRTEKLQSTGKEAYWPTELTKEDFAKLKQLAKEDPKKWYDEVVERSGKVWDRFLTTDGVRFGTGFKDDIGGAYCSKGVCLTKMLGAGLDLETSPSRWAFPIDLMKKWGMGGTEEITDRRFVAPVSIFAQPYQKDVHIVDFPPMSSRERKLAITSSFTPATNKDVAIGLRAIPWDLPQGEDSVFTKAVISEIEEIVSSLQMGISKSGPSSKMRSNYGQAAQVEKNTHLAQGKKPPKEQSYTPEVGSSAVGTHEALKADGPNEVKDQAQAINDFLVRMRFEDFSKQMRESLEQKLPPNELSEQTAKENEKMFEMVNIARELATHILARTAPNMVNPAVRDRLFKFTGELLSLAPVAPVKEIPNQVRNEKDPLKKAAAVENYVEQSQRHRGEMQLEAMVSDYIKTVYGADYSKIHLNESNLRKISDPAERIKAESAAKAMKEDISKVTNLFSEYLYRIYLDPQIGSTRWLGRAVTLGIAREANLKQKPEYLKELSEQLEAQGHSVENYLGNNLKMSAANGTHRVEVQTGEPIYGRSNSQEAGVISSVAIAKNKAKAKANSLNGNLISLIFPVNKSQVKNGLSTVDRLRNGLAQSQKLNQGFSHVGTIDVARDPESGVETVWVWDNYPYHDEGKLTTGVRINGIEHFGNAADYTALGFAHFDYEKLHDYAQKQALIAKMGDWDPLAWEAFQPKLDEDGKIVPEVNPKKGNWMKLISKEDFIKLNSIQDRAEWEKQYKKLVVDGWRELMRRGTYFNWVDAGAGHVKVKDEKGKETEVYVPGKYHEGGGYCSQSCNLASLLFTGIDLEAPDNRGYYAWFVKYLKPVLKAAKDLDLTKRILPPSSLATQDWVTKPVERIQYPGFGVSERLESREMQLPVEQDLEITELIRRSPEYLNELAEARKKHIDPVEREQVISGILYRMVAEAVATGSENGLEVIGYDPDEIEKLKNHPDPKVGKTNKKRSVASGAINCVNGFRKFNTNDSL